MSMHTVPLAFIYNDTAVISHDCGKTNTRLVHILLTLPCNHKLLVAAVSYS